MKFNKEKCARCQYRGTNGLGVPVQVNGSSVRIYCNFCGTTDKTCLRMKNRKEVYDIRGNDYNNCKMFVEGNALESKEKKLIM